MNFVKIEVVSKGDRKAAQVPVNAINLDHVVRMTQSGDVTTLFFVDGNRSEVHGVGIDTILGLVKR